MFLEISKWKTAYSEFNGEVLLAEDAFGKTPTPTVVEICNHSSIFYRFRIIEFK